VAVMTPAQRSEDTKRALHVCGHLISEKNRQVVTVRGEAQMGIGVAGQLRVRVGGDPAGQVGIALDPICLPRKTSREYGCGAARRSPTLA